MCFNIKKDGGWKMKTLLMWIGVYAVMAIVTYLERYDLFKIIWLIILGAFTAWYMYDTYIKKYLKK